MQIFTDITYSLHPFSHVLVLTPTLIQLSKNTNVIAGDGVTQTSKPLTTLMMTSLEGFRAPFDRGRSPGSPPSPFYFPGPPDLHGLLPNQRFQPSFHFWACGQWCGRARLGGGGGWLEGLSKLRVSLMLDFRGFFLVLLAHVLVGLDLYIFCCFSCLSGILRV